MKTSEMKEIAITSFSKYHKNPKNMLSLSRFMLVQINYKELFGMLFT